MLLFVLLVLFDSMSEKCVTSGRVVVVVSLSSCSFLLVVDEGRTVMLQEILIVFSLKCPLAARHS